MLPITSVRMACAMVPPPSINHSVVYVLPHIVKKKTLNMIQNQTKHKKEGRQRFNNAICINLVNIRCLRLCESHLMGILSQAATLNQIR